MSKTISEVIAVMQEQIARLDNESRELKQKVNILCLCDGAPEMYPDVSQPESSPITARTLRLRPDEFTADKLAKAVRRYLEMRKQTIPDNAPATIEEIRAALAEGGFDFKGKDPVQAISISLGKSTHTFKRLTSGRFGLAAWYGFVRSAKPKPTPHPNQPVEAEDEEDSGLDGSPAKVEMDPQ